MANKFSASAAGIEWNIVIEYYTFRAQAHVLLPEMERDCDVRHKMVSSLS